MCFSETQSFLNTILLFIGAFYVRPNYRLSMILIFLGIKDLIQGLLYRYQNNEKIERILSTLSWVHICFQPLFINIFMSHFSQDKNNYWHIIFVISFLYGIYTLTTLNEFDIQNEPDCVTDNEKSNFCAKSTTSYIGKYHIAYKFSRDAGKIMFPIIYLILMFLPSLLTNSRILGIIWGLLVGLIYIIFNKLGSGEKAAIWCFLSIIYFLPVAVFSKQISKFLF